MSNITIIRNDTSPKIEISRKGRTISINKKGTLFNLPKATALTLGGIIVGSSLDVDGDGVLTLPVASTTQLGGIIVGANLSINNGVLNASISGGGGAGDWGSIGGTLTDQTDLYFAFVTLDTEQTISEEKTFSVSPVLSENSAILSLSSATGVKQITTGGTTDLALMPGGKVGIGTTSPLEALQVGGDASANLGIRINSAGDTFVKFREGTGDYGFTINYDGDDTNNLYILTHDNDSVGVRRLCITRASGNIGIANIDPQEKLDITGNLQFDGYAKGDDFKSYSTAFVSGFSGAGFQLNKVGDDYIMTLDNLTVRKSMKVYELLIQKIRTIGGSFWVSEAHKIDSVVEDTGEYTCTIDNDNGNITVEFSANDIIRCQRWTGSGVKYYTAEVISVDTDNFVVEVIDGTDAPEANDEVVRIGNSTNTDRQGSMYLTSSDINAPYLDVMDGVVDESFADKVKVRLGKLDGITDSDLGGTLSGYGLYGGNVYLKGKIVATSGLIGGFTIDATEGIYAGTGATRVQMKVGYGFWAGATVIGDAPFSVTVAGVLKAVSGTIGGWNLDTDAIYTGTKSTDDGFNESSGITYASDGSIHSPNFYLDADGEVGMAVKNSISSIDGTTIFDENGLSMNFDDYPSSLVKLNQYTGIEIYKAHTVTQPKLLKIGVHWNTQKPIINFANISDSGKWSILTDNYLGYSSTEADLSATKIISWTTDGLSVVNELASQSGRVKKTLRITATTTLTKAHHIIVCNNTSSIDVDLPAAPATGQEYIIKRINSGGVRIDGNGKTIYRNDSTTPAATIDITSTNSWWLIYDGTNWVTIATGS